jgi:hypothetical protein
MTVKHKGIWLLASGSYSDYRIHAAFAAKDMAEAVQTASVAHEAYDIEYREIFDSMPERRMLYVMRVQRGTGADWGAVEEWTILTWPWSDEYPTTDRPKVKLTPLRKSAGLTGYQMLLATGRNQQAVRQAFSDRLAQARAEEEGIA